MIDPSLALFAIEAGVRLGRKLNQVLVDETAQRPLLMPLGDLFGSVTEADAMRFFSVEQPELIRPGGACHAIREGRPRLIQFYQAVRGFETQAMFPAGDWVIQRQQLIGQLGALDQFDRQFQAKHPARRILGTVVEIGIDYFSTHPEALGKDSSARKIVHAFVSGLGDTDFAEGTGRQILGDLLGTALRVVGEHAGLIDDDRRLTVLLGAVTGAVAEDLRKAVAEEDEVARHQLFRRIGSSMLRGAASAFAGEIALFIPQDSTARTLIQSTLGQVLEGIRDKEDLFTSETLETIVRSALRATAENAGLLTDNQALQSLIQRTTLVLADRQWDKLFSSATAGAVLYEVLEVARENIETLIHPDRPQEQFLAQALAAMAGSLSAKLAGGGKIQDLLSRRQVVELARVVLQETAENPELLIGADADDPRKTVLAQVIASVARALGEEPTLLTNGEGIIQLSRIALRVTLRNAHNLIDLDTTSPAANLLCQVLQEIVTTLTRVEDPRELITRKTFEEIVERVLPVVSANLEPLGGKPKIVGAAIASALELARGGLAGRIDGANVGRLAEHILTLALWDELDIEDKAALEKAARLFLEGGLKVMNPSDRNQHCRLHLQPGLKPNFTICDPMKLTRFFLTPRLWLILACTIAASGCSTLQYRTIQTRFEETVRADNDKFAMPFTEVTDRYRALSDELTPEYIAGLDPLLQPNAWTIRAVSQWRAANFAAALESATHGLEEIARQQPASPQLEHGRDSIILTMLPGLVEDSRLRERFNANGASDVSAHYDEYAARFHTALRALGESRASTAPATPPEVIAYWNYHAWRVLVNWLFIIGQLPLDSQAAPNQSADDFVKELLVNAGFPDATTLPKGIEQIQNLLQPPYRQLIELERRR